MISIIVAIAQDRAIGYKGDLIYHLSADLKRFKALTTGHTVLMGRKTFESLPKGALPNRRNIVLTRQQGVSFPGTEVYPSITEALEHCAPDEKVFIIGGAQIYAQALELADELEITLVHDTPAEADTLLPGGSPHPGPGLQDHRRHRQSAGEPWRKTTILMKGIHTPTPS